MTGQRPCGGPGRGRKMTLRGKARECAENVLSFRSEWSVRGSVNGLYQMAYWGKAMRGHVEAMRVAGEVMDKKVQKKVEMAEDVLKEFCDGKDCSFKEAK